MEKLTRRGFVRAAGVAVVAAGRLRAFQPATVVSDLAAPAVRFNRMLFGQFLEHFQMYANLLEPNVLAAKVSSEPLKSGEKSVSTLDAVVTSSDDRKRFAVALINRHPDQPVECKLNLGAPPRDGAVQVRLLSGDSTDACNDVDRPGRVAPETREWRLQGGAVQLPPHSVSIMQGLV